MKVKGITQYQREEILTGQNFFDPETELAHRLDMTVEEVRAVRRTAVEPDFILLDTDCYLRGDKWSKRRTKVVV